MNEEAARQLEDRWSGDSRWSGIERTYAAEDVVRLRGSVVEEHTLAKLGAERLWQLIQADQPVRALGALTGGQAVQMVRAGLEAIYLSGWQVAADASLAGARYPDQSLYPANSAPALVHRLNNALLRADQIDWAEGRNGTYWLAPILADAEAGFGGPLNAYELMRAMIEAGAAGVHYEDQLASAKRGSSRMPSASAFPASRSPTTARRRSTGASIWTTTKSRLSRTRWASGATATSSSRSPASTRSTPRCSSSRAATPTSRCPRTCGCSSGSSSSRSSATPPRGTSTRSAPATSTWSHRRWPPTARRSRSRARPRRRSSRRRPCECLDRGRDSRSGRRGRA